MGGETYYGEEGSEQYDSYHFQIGNDIYNGGQNAIHITNDNATPGGFLYNTSIPVKAADVSILNGSFYISDTGGRGYEDEAILLIAVNKSVNDEDFTIRIKAEGYKFDDHAPSASPDIDDVGPFNPDAYDRTFDATNFLKNTTDDVAYEQDWRPGTDNSNNLNRKLFVEENYAAEPDDYRFIFVDLNVSVVGTSGVLGGNSTYRTGLTYFGNPKITYNITGLDSPARVAFVPYAYVNYTTGGGSFFNHSIGWTSRVDTSSWLVNTTP